MTELLQTEYKLLFGCTPYDRKWLGLVIEVWNDVHGPADAVRTTRRRATGTLMVYREELPESLKRRLDDGVSDR